MATKRDVVGTWDIVETEAWDARALHVGGPAHLTFDRDGMGGIAFVAVSGGIDYRVVTRDGKPAVEFCWQGFDEGDPVCGRGWAFIEGDVLRGRLFIYGSDDSLFVARRSAEA